MVYSPLLHYRLTVADYDDVRRHAAGRNTISRRRTSSW